MKIKRNKEGQILIQLNPNDRYCLLFHRIKNNKYEQYIKVKNKEYILTSDELKQVKEYIKNIEV